MSDGELETRTRVHGDANSVLPSTFFAPDESRVGCNLTRKLRTEGERTLIGKGSILQMSSRMRGTDVGAI